MISESGLFMLLDKSVKPKAIELKRILYGDILPSIRKTGKYIVNSTDKKKLKRINFLHFYLHYINKNVYRLY